jgi:hypothetical protein
MPAPSPDVVNAIVERLKQAVTDGVREPTAILSADEHRAMVDLHMHDALSAGVVLQHVKEHARALGAEGGWRAADINRINFRMYERAASQRAAQAEEIDRATNVVRLAAQRNARVRRARTHDVSGEINDAQGLSVEQMLETDSPVLIALGLLRQHRAGRIWYDEFYKATRTNWHGDSQGTVVEPRLVNDAMVYRVMMWLHASDRRLIRISAGQVNQMLDAVGDGDRRNAPRDWIAEQVWDGVPRLGDMLETAFGARHSDFNYQAGRCWFVSMVARVNEPGCKVDTMPVFIGPQGARKSQALEVIGGEWYRAAASSMDSKDFLQELHGALVFEVPELHSLTASRQGAAKVKAVVSTRIDNFRTPYGMRVDEHRRTAVMAGTTNNRDWHTDETGGRRFWPIHCGRINLPWLREHRAQLFAEALVYYRMRLAALADGATDDDEVLRDDVAIGQWWNVPEGEQEALIEDETFVHPYQERIAARLASENLSQFHLGRLGGDPVATFWDGTANESTDWGNTLTVTRIGVQWLDLSSDSLGRGSAAGKTIGACMRALGFETRQLRRPGTTERVKVYVVSLSRAAEMERQRLAALDVSPSVLQGDTGDTGDTRDADERIPF